MDVKQELIDHGCIYTGHFVGVSGKHLAGYCNLDPIFPHTAILSQFAKLMVEPFASENVDTVVSPATGAIPLSQWGSYHLEQLTGKTMLGVWADKAKPEGFAFERSGFLEAVQGKRVVVLEDMINQMHSIKKVVALLNEVGATIVGVACIAANRGVSAEAISVPKLVKLCDVGYDVWTPEECPVSGLCSKNIPIVTDVGHGDDYQKEHPDYPGGYTTLLDK